LLLISAAVYLAMPRTLFEVNMADQRLPIAATFMTIACMHVELRHRLVRRGFLALALAVLMLRVTEVDFAWAQLSPLTLEFRNSVKRIKPGSRILVAYADPSGGDDVVDLGLVHAACLAMIERSALVATAFTVPGKQIMHVRPDYMDQVDVEDGQPPTVEQIVEAAAPESDVTGYWRSWQDRFDYVYILFTDDEARNPLPQQLKPVYDGGRFQLYRVIKPNSAEAAASGGGAQ
jgi:mannosyltransferase OCH1-like enzyme